VSDVDHASAGAASEREPTAEGAFDASLEDELTVSDVPATPDDPGVEDPRDDTERERDEYLDALRRLQADFENYRKRVDRQFAELAARGVVALVTNLLPVLDTLDLAEDHLLGEGDDAVPGTETRALVQARAQLLDTLVKDGLERVGTQGEAFDPQIHDAVAHTEGDDGPLVDEVLRAGYRWRGQMLRPAMVKVRG
jgi:molecular chaperone GrpE